MRKQIQNNLKDFSMGDMMSIKGRCHVPGCSKAAVVIWRHVSEKQVHKICREHFKLHDQGKFNMWTMPFPPEPDGGYSETHICTCGEPVLKNHRYCTDCKSENNRIRNRAAYLKKQEKAKVIPAEVILKCKECGRERLPNHIFCEKCARHKKTMARRQAQIRYERKQQRCLVQPDTSGSEKGHL